MGHCTSSSPNRRFIASIIFSARSTWDTDSYLVGVQNGVVDLRTGKLRDGRAADRITVVAAVPYLQNVTCPRWERFIDEISDGDKDRPGFLQRSFGYSLTGDTEEQKIWIGHGDGSNGKSTLLRPGRRR